MPDDNIRIIAPMVTSLSASLIDVQEPHVTWSIGYAPEPDGDGERYLLVHLHVGGADGRADVDVSASLIGGPVGAIGEGEPSDDFAALLSNHPSLDGLYATARTTALGLLGIIEADGFIPLDPPDPTITRLIRATEERES